MMIKFLLAVIFVHHAYGQSSGDCKDKYVEKCEFWVRHRTCRSHPHHMAKWCPKSCGLCDSEEKCMRIKCDPPRKCSLDAQGMPVCICPLFCKHRRAKRSLGMVCGTNNKEYKDRCKLEISACELNQTVSVKQYGACPAMSPPCADSYEDDQCSSWKPFGVCDTYKELMKVACPYTCGLCKPGASSLPKCQVSKYGCCPDLKTSASGPLGQGCGKCRDRRNLCRHFMRDCNSSNLGNRKFMEKNCPKSCGFC